MAQKPTFSDPPHPSHLSLSLNPTSQPPDGRLVARLLQLGLEVECFMAINKFVRHTVPHAAAQSRLDRTIDGPIALRRGGANGLRQHTPRD